MRKYPSPATRDYKGSRSTENCLRAGRNPATNSLGDNVGEGDIKGQLNPDWVEWLMGWPIMWTSLEPMEELIWLDWSVDPADVETNRIQGIIPRVSTNIPDRVNRLKAIGNGQVCQCTALAWEILT